MDDDERDMLPENYLATEIFKILSHADGMTNCMALGILECVKQDIFETMHRDGDEEDYG